LIYDHNGKRMTASHAVKDGKRYRYYISNSLIAGRDAKHSNGHRIPAHRTGRHRKPETIQRHAVPVT